MGHYTIIYKCVLWYSPNGIWHATSHFQNIMSAHMVRAGNVKECLSNVWCPWGVWIQKLIRICGKWRTQLSEGWWVVCLRGSHEGCCWELNNVYNQNMTEFSCVKVWENNNDFGLFLGCLYSFPYFCCCGLPWGQTQTNVSLFVSFLLLIKLKIW